jgi:MGT family glycosyltransferase
MARFLLCTAAAAGHVTPVVSISRALVERGHEVVWITGRAFSGRVHATGATFHPFPESIDPGDRDLYEFYPELRGLHGTAQLNWYFKHVFLDAAPGQIQVIDSVLGSFDADVLIGDLAVPGVFYKSELSRIPSAMISLVPLAISSRDTAPFGLGLLPGDGPWARVRNRFLNWVFDQAMLRDLNEHANGIRNQLGLPPRRLPFLRAYFEFPKLVMQLTAPAFEYPRSDLPANLHFIGPPIPGPGPTFSPPAWWPDLNGERPVVLVTQGTIAARGDSLFAQALDALRNEDVLVVAAPVEAAGSKALQENARTAAFIPFEHLLPHIDVMVTNGGYGGTQLALTHGVPLVVAGATEDKMEVAARVDWSGAGINLRQENPTSSRIRSAVKQVLANPRFRWNAQRLQNEFARCNAPRRAAELLETLAAGSTNF